MSTLYWLRFARRIKAIPTGPGYPNLETLLEAEASQPHNDYLIAKWVVPPLIAVLGSATCFPLAFKVNPLFLIGAFSFLAVAGGLWFLFDRLDKAIPRSRARIRKLSGQLLAKICRFSNIIGIEPALYPEVGAMLDQAAGIYLKHSTHVEENDKSVFTESHLKAVRALEEGMAKMLELGLPQTARAQQLELERGWGTPLLQEMKALDQALDDHTRNMLKADTTAPLAGLREARLDLQGLGTALDELEEERARNELRG